MKKHLAIYSKEDIKHIFAGLKTIDARFSQKRIAPFGVIQVGDIVYLKLKGEEIVGQFVVAKVISVEGLTHSEVKLIKQNYSKQIGVDRQKDSAKYASLIFIDQLEQFITSPIRFKKKDLRGWVVLND